MAFLWRCTRRKFFVQPAYLRPETRPEKERLESAVPLFYLKALDLILKTKFIWAEKNQYFLSKFGPQVVFVHFLPTSIFN